MKGKILKYRAKKGRKNKIKMSQFYLEENKSMERKKTYKLYK